MKSKQLLLYRPKDDDLLYEIEAYFTDECKMENEEIIYQLIARLVDFGATHGYEGNLWHCYLTHLIVNSENAYSYDCEIRGDLGGTISEVALHDAAILRELFHMDLSKIKDLQLNTEYLTDFHMASGDSHMFNHRIRDCIVRLSQELSEAASDQDFLGLISSFYKSFGVGMFGLHKAFRLDDKGEVYPITQIKHVSLDDLVGYELQKEKLIQNTEAFLAGKKANNCLLFGDAGTGKSTSIKAIANQYYDRGLRIVEVYKHEFKYLNHLIATLKNRNYKFIIYMDDLSFEEFEIEYKYLKAVIEGGLEKKPDNILIYATSNRRHLIHENQFDNKEYDDMHKNDTKQEKLSLSMRFGVTIYFGAPSPKEFKDIVLGLKAQNHITMPDEEILQKANAWEMQHGGLSGRTAQQFIDYLLGL